MPLDADASDLDAPLAQDGREDVGADAAGHGSVEVGGIFRVEGLKKRGIPAGAAGGLDRGLQVFGEPHQHAITRGCHVRLV
jgi:hypothetical protein